MRTRLPVKLKVAVLSAALTFVILCVFAVVVGHGGRAAHRRRASTTSCARTRATSRTASRSSETADGRIQLSESDTNTLRGFAAGDAIVRVVDTSNRPVWASDPAVNLGPPISIGGVTDIGDLRVTSRELVVPGRAAARVALRPPAASRSADRLRAVREARGQHPERP